MEMVVREVWVGRRAEREIGGSSCSDLTAQLQKPNLPSVEKRENKLPMKASENFQRVYKSRLKSIFPLPKMKDVNTTRKHNSDEKLLVMIS